MSEKSQFHIPSPEKQGTEFHPDDEINFGQANPELMSYDVVEASRLAYQAASMNTIEAHEAVVTPRAAILQRGRLLTAARADKSGGKLDLENEEVGGDFIDQMHQEQTQQTQRDIDPAV